MNTKVVDAGQAQQDLTVQQTVQRMQQHFVATGAYRAQDLLKVLGDPTKGIAVTLSPGHTNMMRLSWIK